MAHPRAARRHHYLEFILAMALATACSSATAAGPGIDRVDPAQATDPRFAPEAQTRSLVKLWQDSCLKYYRNPLALGTFLLKSGYLKDPPYAASFLHGETGTVWDVSTNVYSQRVLILLDNGVCEIRAQVASAAIVKEALVETMARFGSEGAVVRKILDEEVPDLGHPAFRYMYSIMHGDDHSIWTFGASGSDNPLATTRAVMAISRKYVRSTSKPGSATVTLPAAAALPSSAATGVAGEQSQAGNAFDPQVLKGIASPQLARQVEEAIVASELIRADIRELQAGNRFAGFTVARHDQINSFFGKFFRGLVQDRQVVFTPELLVELKKDRLFDVAYPDDILPDNTVFAIAHLLHHVRYPIDPKDYSNPRDFSAANLRIEAGAYIHAWNASIQLAQKKNDGKPLTPMQIGQVLMNLRYRFAYIAAMDQKDNPLVFDPNGELQPSEVNLRSLAAALGKSTLTDLQ